MARLPLGVLLLAVLNIVTGILMLLGSTPLLNEFNWVLLTELLQTIPYGGFIIAVVYIILGLGLISLAKWAWYADIIFALFNLVLIFLDIFAAGAINLAQIAWIPLLLNLIIVIYLNQGSIRRKFNY